jgi:hypothetical protein
MSKSASQLSVDKEENTINLCSQKLHSMYQVHTYISWNTAITKFQAIRVGLIPYVSLWEMGIWITITAK